MKSKRKVFEHLNGFAYTRNASHRIMGFLLGVGVIEKGDVVEFKNPEDDEIRYNFDHFYEWFENEEEELAVFGGAYRRPFGRTAGGSCRERYGNFQESD